MGDFSWSKLDKQIKDVQKIGERARFAVLRRGYDEPGDSIADKKYVAGKDAGDREFAPLKTIEGAVKLNGRTVTAIAFNKMAVSVAVALDSLDNENVIEINELLRQSGSPRTVHSIKQSIGTAVRRFDDYHIWVKREVLRRLGPSGKRQGAWQVLKFAWPALLTVPDDIVVEEPEEEEEESFD